MRSTRLSFAAVRRVGLTLAGVEESTMYGAPALKVGKQMFACMASHKSAEPNALVVRMDVDRRDELIAADPAVYYLTDHYLHYPSVYRAIESGAAGRASGSAAHGVAVCVDHAPAQNLEQETPITIAD